MKKVLSFIIIIIVMFGGIMLIGCSERISVPQHSSSDVMHRPRLSEPRISTLTVEVVKNKEK